MMMTGCFSPHLQRHSHSDWLYVKLAFELLYKKGCNNTLLSSSSSSSSSIYRRTYNDPLDWIESNVLAREWRREPCDCDYHTIYTLLLRAHTLLVLSYKIYALLVGYAFLHGALHACYWKQSNYFNLRPTTLKWTNHWNKLLHHIRHTQNNGKISICNFTQLKSMGVSLTISCLTITIWLLNNNFFNWY